MADETLSAFPETCLNHGFYGPEEEQKNAKDRRKNREERGLKTMQLFVFILATMNDKNPFPTYRQGSMT